MLGEEVLEDRRYRKKVAVDKMSGGGGARAATTRRITAKTKIIEIITTTIIIISVRLPPPPPPTSLPSSCTYACATCTTYLYRTAARSNVSCALVYSVRRKSTIRTGKSTTADTRGRGV